jgi:hypothetical protein
MRPAGPSSKRLFTVTLNSAESAWPSGPAGSRPRPETIPPHIHVADTIEVEPEGDDVYIGSRHPRALMLEKGTSPHEIRPHAGGVLAWRGGDGKMRFARVVHHPGTRAQPFLRPALYTPEV